uniref:RPM1-interacting protein 4 n=1 Tax=Noccaea caerulescens TaxID=107243 RepID=A0A1J3G3Q4_NOCCA
MIKSLAFLISQVNTLFGVQENKGRPLPKFGEWDVNNPASAEGFTVIFSKASDEKKTKKASGAGPNSLVSPHRNQNSDHHDSQTPKAKNKWFCFR